MLRKIVLLVLCLSVSWQNLAAEIVQTNPYQMMQQISEEMFARLRSEQNQIRQKPELLKEIVKETLFPYIDTQYAALKVLGSQLKGAKREDVQEFINAFDDYMIRSYAQVLAQYRDQKIIFDPAPKLSPKRKITGVKVKIVDPPRPDIKLEFRLRRIDDKKGERPSIWKAFDIIAEGISLIDSKRSEWQGELREKGILAVAKEFTALAEQPIQLEDKKS